MRKTTQPYLVVIQGIQNLSLKDTGFGKSVVGDMGQMIAP